MTKVIWKYPLKIAAAQTVMMPAGAVLLSVGLQNQSPQLWAEVDPVQPPTPRPVLMAGTGHALPGSRMRLLGRLDVNEGEFIFHVYEGYPPFPGDSPPG